MQQQQLTAHLEKSIISNIIQTARASLANPSRPFTPAEPPRSLFQQPSAAPRPPSAYSVKALRGDIEAKSGRSRQYARSSSKPSLQQSQRSLHSSSFDSLNVRAGDKPYDEYSALVEELSAGSTDDFEDVLRRVTRFARANPETPRVTALLKELAISLESQKGQPLNLLMGAKTLMEALLDSRLLFKPKSKLALGSVKLVYQFSKDPANDEVFSRVGLIDSLIRALSLPEARIQIDLALFLLGTVKNLTVQASIQQRSASLHLVALLDDFLTETSTSKKLSQLCVQVTCILKNLVQNLNCFEQMIEQGVPAKLTRLLATASAEEVVLHSIRALSTLSLDHTVCTQVLSNETAMRHLLQTLQKSGSHAVVASRVCYILANVATVHESARAELGASCVDSVHEFALQEYLHKKNKSAVDVLEKGVRLIANVVLHPSVGRELPIASKVIDTLCSILSVYDIQQHEELILNAAACATNLLFYDTPANPLLETDTARLKVLARMSPLLVQAQNEEITLEAVRALGNLTRHASVCTELAVLHIPEILFVLLDSSNPSIVLYSLGCFTNISCVFRSLLYNAETFTRFTDLLQQFALSDIGASTQLAMVLCNLCSPCKGMVTWENVADEDTVKHLTGLVKDLSAACEELAAEELRDLASVLEGLLELLPQPDVACSFPECGRRFPTQQELDAHWARRHAES